MYQLSARVAAVAARVTRREVDESAPMRPFLASLARRPAKSLGAPSAVDSLGGAAFAGMMLWRGGGMLSVIRRDWCGTID